MQAVDAADILLPMTLRDYQTDAAEWLARHPQALLADEMGVGKTCELITGADLAERRRIVVVCPVVLIDHWIDEIHKWSDGWATARLVGTRMTDLAKRLQMDSLWRGTECVVLNYDILHAYDLVLGAWADLVIFDESHYLKNKGEFDDSGHCHGTRRTACAKRLAANVRSHKGYVWLASGTPMPSRPIELYSQLDILGVLTKLGLDWEYFITRYCEGRLEWVPQRGGGKRKVWKYDGASNLKELRKKLDDSCMLRRLRRQVMPDITVMPPALYSIPLDPKVMSEYAAAEKNIADYMGQRAFELACEIGAENPADEAVIARMKAEAAKHLVELSQLRRLAGQAKLSGILQWVNEWMEGGAGYGKRKLVLFGHHREILAQIAEAFSVTPVIGGVANDVRADIVKDFQENPATRLIVLSTQAAGIGLNLTASSDVAFCEYEWTSAAHRQATDRCARHGQKNPVSVFYLIARGTVDAYMARHIAKQMSVVDAVFGADDVAGAVINELLGEK